MSVFSRCATGDTGRKGYIMCEVIDFTIFTDEELIGLRERAQSSVGRYETLSFRLFCYQVMQAINFELSNRGRKEGNQTWDQCYGL